MDYKYIEQLLERYWECQTTLEEETILRKFFAQEDIPASLLPYRDLFLAEENMAQAHLSEDFDARLMERLAIGQPTGATLAVQKGNKEKRHAKVIKISITQQLRPLYRAAAMVAIVLSIGMAAQQGFERNEENVLDNNALATSTDSTELFIEQPEMSPQAEAVLTTTQTDSLLEMKVEN